MDKASRQALCDSVSRIEKSRLVISTLTLCTTVYVIPEQTLHGYVASVVEGLATVSLATEEVMSGFVRGVVGPQPRPRPRIRPYELGTPPYCAVYAISNSHISGKGRTYT